MKFASLIVAASLVAGAFCASAATVPQAVDTMNPLPGLPTYKPFPLAINNTTKRVYTTGAGETYGSNGRVSVIDAQTNSVVSSFTLEWGADMIAVNESTNTIYIAGYTTSNFNPTLFAIDGNTNQVIKQVNVAPRIYYMQVDPVTGRVFATNQNDSSVRVYDGSSLVLLAKIDLTDGSNAISAQRIALNPTSRKLYVSGGSAPIAVINLDSLGAPSFMNTGSGGTGNIVADPATNRLFVAASVPNGSNSFSPAILVYNSASDSLLTSIPFPADDPDIASGLYYIGATVDPIRHRAYFSDDYPNFVTHVIDTQNNVSLGSYPIPFSFAGVESGSGRLFITQSSLSQTRSLQAANGVGVVDPAAGNYATIITTGYRPYRLALNPSTSRLYVADQQANDLLVFNTNDHSLVRRVLIGQTDASGGVNDNGSRDLALSLATHRAFVTGSAPPTDPNSVGVNNRVTVVDTTSNTVSSSFTVAENAIGYSFVAVDDSRHRLYVTATPYVSGSVPTLYVYNLDTLALVTSVGTMNSVTGLSVNPITGRIYVETVDSGGGLQIFDPTNYTPIGFVATGRLPGEIAYDTQRNKVYVANTGAGSVDNTITVINATNDASEATLNNIQKQTSHDITSVAVDQVTNTVYGGDDSNGSGTHGYISVFNGPSTYDYVTQVDAANYPVRLLFNQTAKELYAATYNGGNIEVFGTGAPAGPPPPSHGGLSDTFFRVNGSKTPSASLADTVLHFAAQQSGTPNGLVVRVQYNTVADNNRNDWLDLNNGTGGYMTIDKNTGQFVLSSTNYPLANGIYFRAVSMAPGYPNSASNIVGPFDLTPGKAHLGTTTLLLSANGGGQPMYFRALGSTDQAGITFYMQATTTPDNESSWVGLKDGRDGQMFSFPDVKRAYLDSDKYPTGDPVYFRAVAKAVGFVDSYSNIVGVAHVVNGTPPEVSVFPSSFDQLQPGSGSGTTPDDPLILQLGSAKFSVVASGSENNSFKKLALYFDGTQIDERHGGATSMNTDYTTNVPGDHILKAYAIDERGVIGYANPTYLRILPAGAKVYKSIASGNWNDASIWQDANGNSGVPGVADFAVIPSGTVAVTTPTTVLAIALNGVNNATVLEGKGGSLTVNGMCTLHNGTVKEIDMIIAAGATMEVTSDRDVPISGTVTNHGTIRLTGQGGIVPVGSGAALARASSAPAQTSDFLGIGAFFKNLGDIIFNHPKAKAPKPSSSPAPSKSAVIAAASLDNKGRLLSEGGLGLISNDGGSLAGNSGGTIISNDGAGLISNDGGSLVTDNGSGIISNDGASAVAQGGGNVIVRPNAGSAAVARAVSAASGGSIQSSGQINLTGLMVYSSVTLDGGLLTGKGPIFGDLTNNSGFVSPGNSAGQITVLGNFTQGMQGTLIVDDGGPGDSDLLQVTGNVTLGGKLDVRLIDNNQPSTDDTFSPLGYGSASGGFNSSSANAQVTANSTGLLVSADPAKPSPVLGQPVNISTRAQVLAGDSVMIGGFILTGSTPKTVVIRTLGPTLGQFGVAGVLADPNLSLFDATGRIATNDNWRTDDVTGQSQESSVPANLRPPNDLDSVIVKTLQPNQSYTVIVRGNNGGTGVALVEAYDNDPSNTSRFTNISTRGVVGTNDNVMIGGFIVAPNGPGKVVVRGVGPSLTQFGVQGALQDPVLKLFDGNGMLLETNDNWETGQGAELQRLGKAPTDSREAAILATLTPGSYTAIVSGKNNTSGVGLVEVFDVQ